MRVTSETVAREFTVASLASLLKGELQGAGDHLMTGISSLASAHVDDITFISNQAYARQWSRSNAGAAVVSRGLTPAKRDGDDRPLIYVQDAEIAAIALLEAFSTPESLPEMGVHPAAFVHPTATVGQAVRIGPHVSVDARSTIGDGVVLHPGARVYPDVEIGQGSVIHSCAVIRQGCRIGRGVIIHSNVAIGTDGFGYRPAPDGTGLLKVPHIGNVIIEDGVEIGANTCIDRAKFGSTVIGAGTKIDNLVQIGHNATIGRCCVIAGCVGISGSVTVEDGVQIGGAVGITDHVTVGRGSRIGAMALVTSDVPAGQVTLGHPAGEAQAVLRQWASVRKLPGLLRQLPRQPRSGKQ